MEQGATGTRREGGIKTRRVRERKEWQRVEERRKEKGVLKKTINERGRSRKREEEEKRAGDDD